MISNEQVQYFFTHSEDSICIISSTGKLLYSNPAAEKLFGISAKESVKIWEAVPYIEGNDALIQLFIDSILSKVDTHEAIVDYWNNEGKVRNIHVKMTHFMQDQSVYLVVITDLTQLFKVNSALIRYTSPDIADYALMTAEGQKRGGQTKNVTILMSDLRGFTALGAKLSAEELITVLNHYFEAMVAVIQKYKGTVIEFLGDGIFTVFGAPKDIPEHATLAVKCAVEMQAALKAVNEWNEKNGFPPLEMGVGINTGDAVVGNIGSDKKMKYGCMGSTVNITGRLESLTVGGQVFITDNTRQQIVEDLLIVSEGSFLPKGSPNELMYCEIKGIGDLVLTNDMDNIVWVDNPDDNEYQFYLLEEKTVGVNTLKGKLVKMSDNKRFALITTDAELSEKMNIMLRHEEKRIYAKVIRKDSEGYVICFTSIQQND
ncbi:MAG: PAS domain S-box protein [Clostridiales bacterium]|nr:PAS domain S-box protein [Clostridiales bacterium]MBP3810185.1 PAS domain S-box protein [Clostridiales bacterium]